jgi:carboxyl-terminal processing protease
MNGLLQGTNGQEMAHIDAWFRPGKDGYTVQMVLNGGQAEKAGLRKGDLVVSIENQPFTPVQSMMPYIGKEATIRFKRGGKEFQGKVEVQQDPAMQMFLDASRRSTKVIEHGGKKIGYFHLWTQANDSFRNALSNAVYGPLSQTDAFILDLRDGFGGRPEGFADPFFRPESTLEWKMNPNAPGMKQLFGYQRPLVVLINEGSRSAKEVLSQILKSSKRATLIGSTTAGHVLGTSPMPIEDWAYLEIPMVEVITDGVRLEGKGVEPNIALPAEFDAEGNDLHLKRALEFLTAGR